MNILCAILFLISSLSYSMGTLQTAGNSLEESMFQYMPNEIKRHIFYQAPSLEELGKFAQINREFASIINSFTTQDFNNLLEGKITEKDKGILDSYLNNLVEKNKHLTNLLLVSFIGEKEKVCQEVVDAIIFKCKHIDVNTLKQNGYNYFSFAITFNYPEVVTSLIKAGISTNIPDFNGDTPLMIAAHWGREKIVIQLLEAGADAHIKNKRGLTALDQAQTDAIRKLIMNKIYEEDYQAETQPMDIEQ